MQGCRVIFHRQSEEPIAAVKISACDDMAAYERIKQESKDKDVKGEGGNMQTFCWNDEYQIRRDQPLRSVTPIPDVNKEKRWGTRRNIRL